MWVCYTAEIAGLTAAIFETELFVFSLIMALPVLFGQIRIPGTLFRPNRI